MDSGAVGNGLLEKDITLMISKYMYNLLKEYNIPVYMTRIDDSTLNPIDRTNKINSFIKAHKDVLVISNHINAGGADSHCVTNV